MSYSGQYFDTETGLHFNWHRYYAPELGRYLQPDPLGYDDEGDVALYPYVRNNPLNFTDPTGQFQMPNPHPGTGTTVGAGIGGAIGRAAAGAAAGVLLFPSPAGDPREDEKCRPNDDNPNCKKASGWHLDRAGIVDAEEFKTEWGALPNSKFEICACDDGSIVIKATGTCGKPGPGIPTDRRWK